MRDRQQRRAEYILRIGLAFSFIYAALGGFLEPTNWIGYFPSFLKDIIPDATLLVLWGIFELVIAIWILFGKKIFLPALIAGLSIVGVVVFNWGARDIVFRDISIAAMAFALVLLHYRR